MQAGSLTIKRILAAAIFSFICVIATPLYAVSQVVGEQSDHCVTLHMGDDDINGYLRRDGSFIDCNTGKVYTKDQIKDFLPPSQSYCNCTCNIGLLPGITFKAGAKLSPDAIAILAAAAHTIKGSPACHVTVMGYVPNAVNKASQQLAWDRVTAVIKYLVEKEGISENRLIFSFDNMGDGNIVDMQPTTVTGPYTVPAPFPQYRQKQ